MRQLILIIFISKTLASYESSNEDGKYIDLLPDAEKKQFLDRVARRILAQINTKETLPPFKHSVEITDDQLDKHNDFVKKILEEESRSLRIGGEISEKEGSKEESKEVSKEESNEETSRDALGNILMTHNNDKAHYIDLTLRQRVRLKRNSSTDIDPAKSTTEINQKVIPIKTVYDTESNYALVENTNPLTENNKESVNKTKTDIQATGVNRALGQTKSSKESEIHVIVLQESADKSSLKLHKNRANVTADKSTASIKISTVDDGFSSTDNPFTDSELTHDTLWPTDNHNQSNEFVHNTTGDIPTSNLEVKTLVTNFEIDLLTSNVSESNSNNSKLNNTYAVTNAYYDLNDTDKEFNENASTIQNYQYADGNTHNTTANPLENLPFSVFVNIKNETVPSTKEISPHITTSYLDSVTTITNKQNNNVIGKKSENISHETIETVNLSTDTVITSTTDITPVTKFILQSYNAIAQSKKPIKSIKQAITKNSSLTLKINSKNSLHNMNSTIATNIKHALRQRIDIDETENKEVSKVYYDLKSSSEQTVNTYQVYEIRQGVAPFVKNKQNPKKQKQEDRQYYAPVYNFSPDNAYYYPYNKFGPNFESDESVMQMNYTYHNDKYTSTYNKQENEHNNRKFRFKMKNHEYRNSKLNRKPEYKKRPYQFVLPPTPKRKKPGKIVFDYYSDEDIKDIDFEAYNFPDEYIYVGGSENFRSAPKKLINSKGKSYLYNNKLKDHLKSLRTVLQNKHSINTLTENSNIDNVKSNDVYVIKLPQLLDKRSGENPGGIPVDYIIGREKTKTHVLMNESKMLSSIQKTNPDKSYPIKKYEVRANKVSLQTNRNENKLSYSDRMDKSIGHEGNNLVLENLDKLLGPINSKDEIDTFVTAMRNLLDDESEALQQYDWLETTVKIQSAIEKLEDMTDNRLNGNSLHPADLELLEYVTFLHTVAKHEIEENHEKNSELKMNKPSKKQRNKSRLPRNSHRPKHNVIKTKGLFDRVWLYRTNINVTAKYDLRDFKQFLNDLQNCLYDLHNAVKHISMITSFNDQRWFRNLQDLYLHDAKTKNDLELILHLFTVRLIDLVEDSSKNGLEDNFMVYVKENTEIVRRSVEELIFILRLLEKIKNL